MATVMRCPFLSLACLALFQRGPLHPKVPLSSKFRAMCYIVLWCKICGGSSASGGSFLVLTRLRRTRSQTQHLHLLCVLETELVL
uniref:Uncharacterized protein n=1 Tax=Ixodes ricinus TaxID=34613 RepID=A0A6B0UAE9_IXORI